jgi:hypothetical protein
MFVFPIHPGVPLYTVSWMNCSEQTLVFPKELNLTIDRTRNINRRSESCPQRCSRRTLWSSRKRVKMISCPLLSDFRKSVAAWNVWRGMWMRWLRVNAEMILTWDYTRVTAVTGWRLNAWVKERASPLMFWALILYAQKGRTSQETSKWAVRILFPSFVQPPRKFRFLKSRNHSSRTHKCVIRIDYPRQQWFANASTTLSPFRGCLACLYFTSKQILNNKEIVI